MGLIRYQQQKTAASAARKSNRLYKEGNRRIVTSQTAATQARNAAHRQLEEAVAQSDGQQKLIAQNDLIIFSLARIATAMDRLAPPPPPEEFPVLPPKRPVPPMPPMGSERL